MRQQSTPPRQPARRRGPRSRGGAALLGAGAAVAARAGRARRSRLAGGPAGAAARPRRSRRQAAGASRRSPARSSSSISGRPGASRAALEMPSLEAMAARRRREGVVVAAVNYKEAPEVIRGFLERSPFEPPILLDSDGDATVAWTPRVFPSTVLVGRDGAAGARRRRRARLGGRRGEGAARPARRRPGAQARLQASRTRAPGSSIIAGP